MEAAIRKRRRAWRALGFEAAPTPQVRLTGGRTAGDGRTDLIGPAADGGLVAELKLRPERGSIEQVQDYIDALQEQRREPGPPWTGVLVIGAEPSADFVNEASKAGFASPFVRPDGGDIKDRMGELTRRSATQCTAAFDA